MESGEVFVSLCLKKYVIVFELLLNFFGKLLVIDFKVVSRTLEVRLLIKLYLQSRSYAVCALELWSHKNLIGTIIFLSMITIVCSL